MKIKSDRKKKLKKNEVKKQIILNKKNKDQI
jgi:hypothetical protein